MVKAKQKTRKAARSAITGEFITMKKAKKNPRTTVVETIKTPKKRK